jgi:hypothetical protein
VANLYLFRIGFGAIPDMAAMAPTINFHRLSSMLVG